MRTLMILLLAVSIAGIIASELVLIYAMVKTSAGVSTRTAGKYTMIFLIMLIVVVMVFISLGRAGMV